MRLTTGIKTLYGLSFSAHGIKDGLFQVFLFFYFNQVLGLDPVLTGIATIIALIFDAVSDPIVGIVSDKWKSEKWGRRHPFIIASAIPFAVSIALLFMPPEGLGTMGLFWWLTVFTILTRVSMTFFAVPAMSLGAELSTDYVERTSITSFRVMFGSLASTIMIIIGFVVYFAPTEDYPRGLLNKTAYPGYAVLCAVLIAVTILISAFGTRSVIPHLPKTSPSQESFSFKSLVDTLGTMFRMTSFRTLIMTTMVLYVSVGIGTAFTTYFLEYYFEFSSSAMAVLPVASAIGGLLSMFVSTWINRKMDKRTAVMYCTVILSIFFSAAPSLRLLGLFPSNQSPMLLPSYFMLLLIGYTFIFSVFSLASSMMADVVDESDLITGKREEGLYFSALSFTYKCTIGLGYLFSGLLLKWVALPEQATMGDLTPDHIWRLGIVGGPILMTFYMLSALFIRRYPIDRKRYESIRIELDQRNF